MHGVRMLLALMIGASLGLVPSPSWPQPKPDAYVSIGSPITETTPARGTIEKIVVTVGNQSNMLPVGVDYTAAMTVIAPPAQVVCEVHAVFATLVPNSALRPFQFQVTHPSPLQQPLAQGSAPQGSQPGGALRVPVGRMQEYHVLARVSATPGLCPQVDSNCTNNQTLRVIRVPLGGSPACTRLQ
jgi:hypothetical protein